MFTESQWASLGGMVCAIWGNNENDDLIPGLGELWVQSEASEIPGNIKPLTFSE